MKPAVAVIDTKLGNLRSVVNALEAIECRATIARKPSETQDASHIILPGVGTFGEGMQNLSQEGWIDHLHEEVLGRRKFFLGICLGMQLLGTTGFEHGHHQGLDWIAGTVDRIQTHDPALRVAHVGWNTVTAVRPDPLWEGLGEGATFYFVHSYHLRPDSPQDALAICRHGSDLVVAIRRDNIMGVQFHPEKSQDDGLRLLRNFVSLPA